MNVVVSLVVVIVLVVAFVVSSALGIILLWLVWLELHHTPKLVRL